MRGANKWIVLFDKLKPCVANVINKSIFDRLGYDGRFIDVQVDFLTAKFFFKYEDGKLKIDPGFGLVDFGISIDIAAIIEYLKGNG